MSPNSQVRSAYTAAGTPIRTDRSSEYAIFAQVTHRLKAVDETDKASFARMAQAVVDNQQLWTRLSEDLMSDGNALPIELRGQLLSLAEFVRRHSMAVLGSRAKLSPLIDINTSIMRGLRGNVEVAA